MRPPADTWHVYGHYYTSARQTYGKRVSMCLPSEEEAWRAAIGVRLEAEMCHLVIVHTTHRPHKTQPGHWRPVKKVLWRSGEGKAWFEK